MAANGYFSAATTRVAQMDLQIKSFIEDVPAVPTLALTSREVAFSVICRLLGSRFPKITWFSIQTNSITKMTDSITKITDLFRIICATLVSSRRA